MALKATEKFFFFTGKCFQGWQDNAYLNNLIFENIDHPSYSQDLAPLDCFVSKL